MYEEVYYKLAIWSRDRNPSKTLKSYLKQPTIITPIIVDILRNIKSLRCTSSLSTDFFHILDKIIPHAYFGSSYNRKTFYRIIKLMLTQSAFECIYMSDLGDGFRLTDIPWLSGDRTKFNKIIQQSNFLLLESVVKPLIDNYYKAKRTFNGYEVVLYEKRKWVSFETKIYNNLKKSKHLLAIKKSKDETRGYFFIVPKGELKSGKFRPMIRAHSIRDDLSLKARFKKMNSHIYAAARNFSIVPNRSLYENWGDYVEKVGEERIFGVTLDVQDAFGNVDMDIVKTLITECKLLENSDKKFVLNYITKQYVIYKKKVFAWNKGVLQGDRLSAAICELYMSYMENLHLAEFAENSFYFRNVDDYFFCSTDIFMVNKFIQRMEQNHFVNASKTVDNLPFREENTEQIPFCGHIFNLVTREVRNFYTFKLNYSIRHKFRFWVVYRPIHEKKIIEFIKRALSYASVSNRFSPLALNTVFNTRQTVLENFFCTMAYFAYKFDAVITVTKNKINDLNMVIEIIEHVIVEFCAKAYKGIQKRNGKNFNMNITVDQLKYLSYRAFVVVLKRRYKSNEKFISIFEEKQTNTPFKINVDCRYFRNIPKPLQKVVINRSLKGL